jgi:hypothetical protein
MDELLKLTRADISNKLNAKSLQVTQILQFALILGPVLFFGVCMLLKYMQVKGLPGDEPDLEMLMLPITGLMFVGMLVAVNLLPMLLLKPQSLAKKVNSLAGDPVEWAVQLHRTITIIRMALTEGVALFGLVTIILAVLGNRLDDNSIIWLATLPLVVHVGYGILSFPNKSNVVQFIETRIVGPLRRHSN